MAEPTEKTDKSTSSSVVERTAQGLPPAQSAKPKKPKRGTPKGRRIAWSVIAALLVVVVLIYGPVANSLFNLWQASGDFTTARPTPVPLPSVTPSAADNASLGLDFNKLGSLGVTGGIFNIKFSRPEKESEVKRDANFAARFPTKLPSGYERGKNINMLKRAEFRFTLDLAKARPYLKEIGIGIDLPDYLDGKTLLVTMGDLIFVNYGYTGNTAGMTQAQTRFLFSAGVAPIVNFPDGITLQDIRNGAGRIPVTKIPPLLYSQWGVLDSSGANPLPVPEGMVISDVIIDGGAKGKIYRTKDDATLSWVKDGVFYFMSGGLTNQQLIDAANSLS